MKHHLPLRFGAELVDDGVAFRLWAPRPQTVELCLGEGTERHVLPMRRGEDGWFQLATDLARPGSLYRFGIDGTLEVPDPASRFQPRDVAGPSEVVDPGAYDWRVPWGGRPWDEMVIYELHAGTFSPEGDFAGIARRLDHLERLGVTAIELMPVADFPGRRNWGYDGVLLFAPDSSYGRPEDLKRLVDACHARGLSVLLDVVYNHFGPEGNYLGAYAPAVFTERHHTPWGAAINFDGKDSRTVRDFYIANALYWLEEYRFDGLRFDAVHAICDDSRPDIVTEIAETVRRSVTDRPIHLILENDRNEAHYLARDAVGRVRLHTAQWNDDIHHALRVATSGQTGGYYADYADRPIEHLGRALAEGFAYQGEPSRHRDGTRRGEHSADLPLDAFVSFIQNHDQVGNEAFGTRLARRASREALRAAAATYLLAPQIPMLFQGEEWGSLEPFAFFCDFQDPGLAEAVRNGRRAEFAKFPEFADPKARRRIPDPTAEETFAMSKLAWAELDAAAHAEWLRYYRHLIALRRREIVPRLKGMSGSAGRYRVIGPLALEVSWRLGDGSRLTLRANYDTAPVAHLPEPLAGKMLFATPSHAGQAASELPPHAVVFSLAMVRNG